MVSPWDSYKSHWQSLALLVFTSLLVGGGTVPLGAPQLRQRQNLEHGICNRPLAISVCLESCMAGNAGEFAQMRLFASNLIKYFTNVQPNTIKMAINYCSSIQQLVDWTPSTKVFADYVMGMNQLYTFSTNNAFGAFGPFGTYGAYSPLQPAAGVCLEKAKLSMAQLPPSYQRLVILFTSGRSSNPVYTIQQAQALMFGGAEIFAVTEKELEMSEELKLSVSGPSYLMAVNDMTSLGRPQIDAIITNVCKIERSTKSQVFPVNMVGDLQKPDEQFNLPLLLAQRGDQILATTMSPFNTSTTGTNITSPNSGFSVSETTGLESSSTDSSSATNRSSSEAGDKDLPPQNVSTLATIRMWQNVTEIPKAVSMNQSSFDTFPTDAFAMQSSPFGTTQSGISKTVSHVSAQSVSSTTDSTTFESFHTEAASADLLESNSTQTIAPGSEKTSFTTPEHESTLFSSLKPNSTLEYESTTSDSLDSQNTTLGTLESGRIVTGTPTSEITTFGLLPLVDDSGENLLQETTQSVTFSTQQKIRSEIFRDNNRLPKKSSGVSEVNATFSAISSTVTIPIYTSSTDNPSALTSIDTRSTDNPSVLTSIDTRSTDNPSALTSIDTRSTDNPSVLTSIDTRSTDNPSALTSIDTPSTDNPSVLTSIDTRSTDNPLALTSIDTRSTDNPSVLTSIDTRSTDNPSAQTSIDTRSTDNPSALTSIDTRSSNHPSAQTSTTDDFRLEAEHVVTLTSQTFLPISPTVNTAHDLLQAGVLPSNNSPHRNNLGHRIQSDNSFPESSFTTKQMRHDISDKQNETDGKPPQEFMREECAELEGITDPVMRTRIMQERQACNNSETIQHNTQEMPCIDLSNITSPLVRLNMLLANMPRKPCPDEATKNPFTSTARTEVAPPTNTSDIGPDRPRIVSPAAQETSICIDLTNIFDIYKLGVLLADWPNQFVAENNISTSLKPAHADSISALGVVQQDKRLNLKQLPISDQDQSQQFLHTADTLDTSSTPVMFTPSSLPTATTHFTTTTESSVAAIKEPTVNRSLSSNSSSMLSMTELSTTDSVQRNVTTPTHNSRRFSRVELSQEPTSELENSNLNNLKRNSATISLPSETMSTDPTNIAGATSSIEIPTITTKQQLNTDTFTTVNLKTTNLPCIDISSAPTDTRRMVIELIKPLSACPIESGLAEISSNVTFPETITSSIESDDQNSCEDLARLPPFIKLIVKIFPILNPCKRHNHVKLTKRDIAFNTRNNPHSSLPKPFGHVGPTSKPSIDNPSASTSEFPCVHISILPENDRPLAADFLRLYSILTCDSHKPTHSIINQMGRSDSCVNVTMFSGKERTAIAMYFSVYGIPPCSEARNCLEFTLLPPELLSRYLELYGPVTLCNTKASKAFTEVLGGESTVSPSSATTNELCRDPSIVGELGLTASTSSCHSFVICSGRTPGRNWTHHNLIPCPPQLFWSQEKLSCVSPEESSCVTGLCSGQSTQLKMASVIFPECSEYIQCHNGHITRHCCPKGQIFRDGTCQEGINIGCPSTCENVTQRR